MTTMSGRYEAAQSGVDGAGRGKGTEDGNQLRRREGCIGQASGFGDCIFDDVQRLCEGKEDGLRDSGSVEDQHDSDSDESVIDSQEEDEEEQEVDEEEKADEGEEEEEEEEQDDGNEESDLPFSLRITAPFGTLITVLLSTRAFYMWASAAWDQRSEVFLCTGPVLVALLSNLEIPALVALVPLVALSVVGFMGSLRPSKSRLLSNLKTLTEAVLCCLCLCAVGLLVCGLCHYSAPTDGPTSEGRGLIGQEHHFGTWHTSKHSATVHRNRSIETTPPSSGPLQALAEVILDAFHRGICGRRAAPTRDANGILEVCRQPRSRDIRAVAAAKAARLFIWTIQLGLMLFVTDKLVEKIQAAASAAQLLQVLQAAAAREGVPWAFRERARG